MIATITINPALDKSTDADKLIAEKKIRCSPIQVEAGGGGINVSKAIEELGGESIALFPFGGVNGSVLLKLVQQKGIATKAINVSGNTRENFSVEELNSNKQFRFVMPGDELSESELQHVLQAIQELENISYLICSGSLPPGVPVHFLASIADIAAAKKIKFIADTSGEPLKLALQKGVYLLKPNLTELCYLAGETHLDQTEIEDAALQIIQEGNCEILVISMGSSGAMLVTKDQIKKFAAPVVKKISTVGAGDSMVAGIVWMLQKGEPIEKAVQFGIACGSAATINKGSQLFKKEDCFRFYEWMQKDK